jgi:hypothetical protein
MKKRGKRRLFAVVDLYPAYTSTDKSFLVLFFKKEPLSSIGSLSVHVA